MQLEIKQPSPPEVIIANFDELKQELQNKMDHYRGRVYTDDQIKEAKKDLAALRKFSTAMSDERIRVKKEWMKPVESFEDKIKELTAIVHEPIILISKQVNEFEEQQKAEKKQKIESYWHEVLQADKVPAGICFSHVFNEKMLNASVSMKSIQEAIDSKLEKAAEDLAVIRALPSYAFEAEQVYLSSLDLAKAVSEAHRLSEMAERKAQYEAEQARHNAEQETMKQAAANAPAPESVVDLPTVREWVKLQVFLSRNEAAALGQWLKGNGIKYKAV